MVAVQNGDITVKRAELVSLPQANLRAHLLSHSRYLAHEEHFGHTPKDYRPRDEATPF